MNIYEIKAEYAAVLDAYSQGLDEAVDEETGEIIPLKDYLDKLEGEIKEKITSVALFIKNRQAMVDAIDNQIKILKKRKESEQQKIADAENYLRQATEEHNFEDKDGRFVIKFKKNPASVQIAKGAVVPPEYLRRKIITEPDKKALKAAIKAGKTFDGITLTQAIGMSVK
ncbi:siphovirus Gp157 family protein [Anaerovibrio sp. RM50]|uniref:siphovirus Gp157 family protein n=1 Tax=Anaerovibrio sp. RM50 TaxID=1200557 RepID=UPI00048021B3|nr:siphovirus Gp157 family protein [Anaerovibrio sp. RM50]